MLRRAGRDPWAAAPGPGPHPPLPDLPDLPRWYIRPVSHALSWILVLLGMGTCALLVVSFFFTRTVTVEGSGVLEPEGVWPVRTAVSGLVASVDVAAGDVIRRGQPVVLVETFDLESQLNQTRAQIQAIQAQRSRIQSQADLGPAEMAARAKEFEGREIEVRANIREALINMEVGADVDSFITTYEPGNHIILDQAMSQLVGVEAARLGAEAQSEAQSEARRLERFDVARLSAEEALLAEQARLIEQRIGRAQVVAPADGQVLTEDTEKLVGQAVQQGEVLFEVSDLKAWVTYVLIDQQELHTIAVGHEAMVEVTAFSQETRSDYRGIVGHVPQVPDPNGLYRVRVDLDAADIVDDRRRFRRGLTVRVKVITESDLIARLFFKRLRARFRLD